MPEEHRDAATGGTDVYMLCGGLGTRLRAVVGDRPKPMATIEGRPFLDLLVEHVQSFGFRRIILGIGHMAGSVADHFRNRPGPARIEFSVETSPLGTAGAIRHAGSLFRSDPVIIMNGDSFCAVDFGAMLLAHRASGAAATIAVVPVEGTGDYGSIAVDRSGRITSFKEKTAGGTPGLVNAGVYIFDRQIIDGMSSRVPLSLETDVFPSILGSRVMAWKVAGPLLDIGTPERYEAAKRMLKIAMETAKGK